MGLLIILYYISIANRNKELEDDNYNLNQRIADLLTLKSNVTRELINERNLSRVNVYVVVDLENEKVIAAASSYKLAFAEYTEELNCDPEQKLAIYFAKLRHFREMTIK